MTSRLLKNITICRRYSTALQRLYFQSTNLSYATKVEQGCKELSTRSSVENVLLKQPQRFYAVNTEKEPRERKEHVHSAESLLSSIIKNYKNVGYVNYDHVEKLLTVLETDSEQCSSLLIPENCSILLHACGIDMLEPSLEKRYTVFQRLWNILKQQNLLNKDYYIQKLQVLQHNRSPLADVNEFIEEISNVDNEFAKSKELHNELLKTACSCGNMQQATEILSVMRSKNFALNEENFNALILGHGRNNNLQECQTIIDSMHAAGIAVSKDTQTALFIGFIENDAKERAIELLKNNSGHFLVDQVLRMLRTALDKELDLELLTLLVHELPVEYTNGTDLHFELRRLCSELLHKNKLDTVMNIIKALPEPKFSENQSTDTYGHTILNEIFRARFTEDDIIQFSQMLKETNKNTRSLHTVVDIAMHRSPPSALKYLETLSKEEPLRPHYFWPLIMYNFRRHGESGIIKTLKDMSRFNVECDSETLLIYVLPQMRVTLENPVQGFKMLTDVGLKPSQLLTPTLRHLIGQQKMIEALQIVELYPVKVNVLEHLMPALTRLSVHVRATKRYQQFAKVLSELCKRNSQPKVDFVGQLLIEMLSKHDRLQNDLKSVNRFLTEMQKIGLKMASASVAHLQALLKENQNKSKVSDFDSNLIEQISGTAAKMIDRSLMLSQSVTNSFNNTSSFAKHPRDMSLDELESHLIELESKGMNARGVLRRLLQLCVRENRLERGLQVKEKCDKLRVQVSPGMLASTFDLYIKIADLAKAEEALLKLQKTYPGFQIDEHKFIDYAALLVHENELQNGLDMLEQRASKQRITGGDYVLKNVWNFLTNVAQFAARQDRKLPREQNLTREAFEFLRKHGYCSDHNAILGPIVREYILRCDIRAAVDEVCQIADKFKHTPLQFEILSLLMRLSNDNAEEMARFSITSEEAQTLLKKLTDVVSKIHGNTNMNSALVLALAESGTDNQLRRLLINPDFHINQDFLHKNCEYLGKEGSVRTLLRLAKGARGLSRSINEQKIYNMLLNNFVKTNDYIAALELFQNLEADDELKMSLEFMKELVNLLKVNNINVPSNIAIRAQLT